MFSSDIKSMIVVHKPIPLKVIRIATEIGTMVTPRGIKVYEPGDYIVEAPTGCQWPMPKDSIDNYYDIQDE